MQLQPDGDNIQINKGKKEKKKKSLAPPGKYEESTVFSWVTGT